jgi:hypothetical protein
MRGSLIKDGLLSNITTRNIISLNTAQFLFTNSFNITQQNLKITSSNIYDDVERKDGMNIYSFTNVLDIKFIDCEFFNNFRWQTLSNHALSVFINRDAAFDSTAALFKINNTALPKLYIERLNFTNNTHKDVLKTQILASLGFVATGLINITMKDSIFQVSSHSLFLFLI